MYIVLRVSQTLVNDDDDDDVDKLRQFLRRSIELKIRGRRVTDNEFLHNTAVPREYSKTAANSHVIGMFVK